MYAYRLIQGQEDYRFKTRQKSREGEYQPAIFKLQSQQCVKKMIPPRAATGLQNQQLDPMTRPKTKSQHSQQLVVQKPQKKPVYDSNQYLTSKYPQKNTRNQFIKNRTKKTHSLSYYHNDSQQNEQDDIHQNHISNMSFKDHLLIENEIRFQQHQSNSNLRQQTQGNAKSQEVLEGKRLFSEGQTDQALKIFQDVLITTNNVEARYLLGVCYLSKQELVEAISQFTQLIATQPLFKRNAYILLAIAYKKSNNANQALLTLTQAIKQFSKYFDAYIYRGKLLLKMKHYDKALKDFQSAIDIQPKRSLSYVGQAEVYRAMNQVSAAIEAYRQAIECDDSMKRSALLKQSLLYMEVKEYIKSMQGLNELIEMDPSDSEALYFRGFIQTKLNQINEALLSYEQAIKHNNSKKAVTKSLYEIARLRIDQRDFYGAFYEMSRAEYLDVDHKMLERFKIFTDGVTFLMKRKFEEGVEQLTLLIANHQVSDYLRPLVFQYRAYGYFCISQHSKALADLNSVAQLEKPSIYNKLICEGIQAALQNMFEQSQGFFLKAQKLMPNKMEPYFYKATTLVRFYNYLIPKDDYEKRNKFLNDAIKYMDKAVDVHEQANLLFYRGIVLFAQNKYDLALIDLDKAIEKSEDNVAKHFYVRGMIQACRCAYKPALNDFTITIQLDPKSNEAYFNRAKVWHILGDRNNAYFDVIKYLELNPTDPHSNVYAGNLFFHIGAYEDAVRAYSHNIEVNVQALYLRARCYVILKELNNAMSDLQSIYEHTSEQCAYVDYNMLQTLKLTSNQQQTEGFQESLGILNNIVKKNYEGKIFKKSDIYFYKGVYHFYLQEFEQAQLYIRQSYDLKEEQQNKMNSSLNDSDQFIMDSINNSQFNKLESKQKSLEEFEFYDRTYNLFEYLLNMSIIDIFLGKPKQAIESMLLLCENMKKGDMQNMLAQMIALLQDDQNDGPVIDDYSKLKEFNIFPSHNRLCSIYTSIKMPLNKYKHMEARLSFCLPQVEIPCMNCSFDEKLLESINPNVVENKPEAPWIKRTAEGVIFTDNVQNFGDLDLQSTTRQSQQENSIEQVQQDQNEHDNMERQVDFEFNEIDQDPIDENINDQDLVIDRNTIRQQLMLDSDIASRLEAILNKRKK